MDDKLLKRLKGGNRYREIAEGVYWFQQDNGCEPASLWELLAYLEATNTDRRQIDDCHRLARQYEPRR
jgi:hypothetical protein